MSVTGSQQACKEVWIKIEPYAIPAVITVGATFLVAQVCGPIFAVCFAGVAVGIAIGFPQIIKQITKDDMLISIIRVVITVVLPLFGPWGIAISVGTSVFSIFAQDLRLYTIRDNLAESNTKLSQMQRRWEDRDKARQAMVQECTTKNASAEAFWNALPPADQVVNQEIAAFEQKIQVALESLRTILSDQGVQERERVAQTILDEIEALKRILV